MGYWTERRILIVGVLVVFYLVLAFRAAWSMRRSGRPFALWLVLSILLTSIPAMLLLMYDQYRGTCPADLADEDPED